MTALVGPEAGVPDSTVPPPVARVRSIVSFDTGWLFFKGDATGADQTAFADTTWAAVNEGPFVAANPSAASGGFAPAGVGW